MCVKKKDKNNACIEKEVGACDLKFPHGLKRSKVRKKMVGGGGGGGGYRINTEIRNLVKSVYDLICM